RQASSRRLAAYASVAPARRAQRADAQTGLSDAHAQVPREARRRTIAEVCGSASRTRKSSAFTSRVHESKSCRASRSSRSETLRTWRTSQGPQRTCSSGFERTTWSTSDPQSRQENRTLQQGAVDQGLSPSSHGTIKTKPTTY